MDFQGSHYNGGHGRAEVRIQRLRGHKERRVDNPLGSSIRSYPRQRMVKRRTEAVEVAAGVGVAGLTAILLQGGVGRRHSAAQRSLRVGVVGIPQLDQPKIHQHGPLIRTDDDVLGLDVAVDDSLAMAIGQGIQKLPGPDQHLGLRQKSMAAQQGIQALTDHKVHDQVSVTAFFKEVSHADQAGMLEPGQDGGLTLELIAQKGQRGRIQAGLRRHLFDRDGNIQTDIIGAINRPHPATPQQRGDPVSAL